MTQTAVMPVQDWEPGWIDYDPGAIRVRYNPQACALVLLLSVDNGDGTHTVSTFNMSGALRDTRTMSTEWPNYVQPANAPSRYLTTSDRDAEAVLAARDRRRVASTAHDLPIAANARKADGFTPGASSPGQ